MADQQLNIKLNVIDNASKAFTSVKNSIFNVRNALLGLGAGVAINSLIKVINDYAHVELGALDPESVVTPGIFVSKIVRIDRVATEAGGFKKAA